MPPTFTTVLAEHLSRVSGRGAHEAEDGEPVLAGGIYVAPGGRHMRVVRGADGVGSRLATIRRSISAGPRWMRCSLRRRRYGGRGALALVLTGMGTDGTHGAADIVAAGGSVIAQDEASSVVWGMPRSVAQAGLCSAVLPLDRDRAKGHSAVLRGPVVTPLDYDFLRKCLKERSGLVLSADKQYLVESRLLPVARRAGFGQPWRAGCAH